MSLIRRRGFQAARAASEPERIGNQIDAALVFARANLWKRRRERPELMRANNEMKMRAKQFFPKLCEEKQP